MDGVVYHIIFFITINKAAYLFGALFIVQGVSIIGFMAAFQFGILEDMRLLVASLITTSLLIYRNNRLLVRKVN